MRDQQTRNIFRTSKLEEADGPGLNPTANRTMGEIIASRFSRRGFLQGAMAVTAISATVSPIALLSAGDAQAATDAQGRVPGSAFDFSEVTAGVDANHHVAQGYDADVLLRWGDKVFADAPDFDPLNQSEAAQERQFGYNNDFVGFIPLDGADDRGLLVVNHEYTNEHLMFPGIVTIMDGEIQIAEANETRVNIEMAAHGGTIIEIRRVVFYLGDDERFDYVYKFVTAGKYNPDDRAKNMDLLDEGTLYVARFHDDGRVEWLPLVQGQGPLTAANGFATQADVLIETRRAADLLEATPMDRPEDIQPNPLTGRAYVMLTNNTKRKEANGANPRADNAFGHIIEIIEQDGDFTATTGTWEILVKCGDPSIAEVGATFSTETTANGWFGMPDNAAVDTDGRLWVSTDGNSMEDTGRTDGLWAVDTEGTARGTSRLFYRVPVGGELCGPCITEDMTTFFVAVQHPGDGGEDWEGHGRPSYYEDLSTRWPDFDDAMPVRPAVVAITKQGGGRIG